MTTPTEQYDSNVPQRNDDLATSQGQFLTNFQQLYDAFSENHVALDDSTSPGVHSLIELLASASGFETSAGELSFYSKPIDGQTDQLFMRYQGNGIEVPITNYQIYSIPSTSQRTQYFTFLPGKILVYYGTVNITGFPFNLSLNPGIGKNLVSANFCPSFQATPALLSPPWINTVVSLDGIIRSLELKNPFFPPISNQLMSYIVMVNI